MKDPRLCLFYPLWDEALAQSGIEAHPILIVRPPLHVARSLAARDGMAHGHALALWLRYVLAAESCSRGRDRLIVSYARVVSSWRDVAGDIEDQFGVSFPRREGSAAEADVFLERDMDHHEDGGLPPGSTRNDRDLLGLADALYAVLTRPAAGCGPVDEGIIAKIARAFDLILGREPEDEWAPTRRDPPPGGRHMDAARCSAVQPHRVPSRAS